MNAQQKKQAAITQLMNMQITYKEDSELRRQLEKSLEILPMRAIDQLITIARCISADSRNAVTK